MTIRLVTIDEHVLLRMGLAGIVAGCADIDLVGEAGSRTEALELLADARPDVVTIGVNLPDGDGIAAAQQLRALLPDLGVVLLTVLPAESVVFRARSAGLSACVSKSATVPVVLAAIRHAAQAPHVFVAPDVPRSVQRRSGPTGVLSQRELQVLVLMRDGTTLPRIATLLEVSPATVKTYVSRLYTKLNARNRAQALMIASNRGMLDAA
jgi:DNA-binding NarL/FixJ family response regulator